MSCKPIDACTTTAGSLTTPPGSLKILIHPRQYKIAGIYCGQPAKILEVETQDDPRLVHRAGPMISPQTSGKLVGGQVTSVSHTLAMRFDDPSMGADLREGLTAREIVLGDE